MIDIGSSWDQCNLLQFATHPQIEPHFEEPQVFVLSHSSSDSPSVLIPCPSVRRAEANIGVAMGIQGTEVAKGASVARFCSVLPPVPPKRPAGQVWLRRTRYPPLVFECYLGNHPPTHGLSMIQSIFACSSKFFGTLLISLYNHHFQTKAFLPFSMFYIGV